MESSRWVTDQPLLLEPLLAETEDAACGALVVFAGTVRDHHEGNRVSALTYEAHETLAAEAISTIEARYEGEGLRCRICHRTGALALGDTAVLVVVRAPHRREAFAAAEAALEAVKQEVPIWKHEHYAAGESRWLDGQPLLPIDGDNHA